MTNIKPIPILTGLAASPGVAVGLVKKIDAADDNIEFPEGSVLVAQMTDPSMLPYMHPRAKSSVH